MSYPPGARTQAIASHREAAFGRTGLVAPRGRNAGYWLISRAVPVNILSTHMGVNPMTSPEYNDPAKAFDQAIREHRLNDNPQSPRYAGHFMYMGRWNGADQFKHVDTRRYLQPSPHPQTLPA